MNKFKITFIFSILIVLLISIGSINAENIDQDDSQILDTDSIDVSSVDEELLENSNSNDVSSVDGELLENSNFDDGLLESSDINEDIVEESYLNNALKENNGLNDEISSSNSDIAKNINVSFSHTVFENDTGNITVKLPEDASGYLRATIDDVEIYNESINGKSVQIPIKIPQSKLLHLVINSNIDYSIHKVSVFYNGVSLNFNHNLKLMKYPQNHGFYLYVPEEILKGDSKSYQSVSLIFPSSAKGTVNVYIDGKFFQKLNVSQFTVLDISKINSLSLGTHTIKAIYSGDEYYLSCERNKTFKVVDFLIEIPSKIVLDHDDCIYAKSVKYTDGTVTVYFDGKKVMSKKLDSSHEFLESLFDKVSCGEHVIEVKYTSSKFNYSKKQKVNVSYVVDIWGSNFRYGDDNSVIITVPHDFNKSLIHIKIDNKAFSSFKIDDDGWIELNVSKFTAGNHTLVFKFDGDKKYYAYNQTYKFTVRYDYKVPDVIEYLDGSAVSLDLPSNAKGNLELYINNKLYKSVKLVNGKASIKVDNFDCGVINISLKYTGNDYKVANITSALCIEPKIISPISIKYGQNKYIVAQVSKGTKGYLIFTVGKKKYKVTIKDGKARLSLKKFKIGEYYIDVDYFGQDGYNCSSYTYVKVSAHKIKIKGAKNLVIRYTSNKYFKVKVYNKFNKLAKGVIVRFKVGKKVYKVKTNKKGIAKLKLSKFAPKTYKITISYKGTKVTKKLTVKHILRLKKVKVRKYAKKLVLKASLRKVNGKYLKGKIIKFRFKGKTYKAKTNSKGIAKVTIKRKVLRKLKIAKKITYKAFYIKDSAKRTVKIKR